MAVSEMLTCDSRLWHSPKSRQRLPHADDPEPRAVQIAGSDPQQLAESAQRNAALGAQLIDINMGCPAKKVCNKQAGSALMKDERLVSEILHAVVAAVDIPVTLKIRTGWDQRNRNALNIAKLAEQAGIAALAVHGRTRADRFNGQAEYDTIAQIKQSLSIPVFANGDIDSPQKAQQVLRHTGADALLIGRAAQGQPWIFRDINHFLSSGKLLPPPSRKEIGQILLAHLAALYECYGEHLGIRITRKHVGWYLTTQSDSQDFRARFNRLTEKSAQLDSIQTFFSTCPTAQPRANGKEEAA